MSIELQHRQPADNWLDSLNETACALAPGLGRAELLAHAILEQTTNLPPPQPDEAESLIRLADLALAEIRDLLGMVEVMERTGIDRRHGVEA